MPHRAEIMGFPRAYFPMEFRDHFIIIVTNDCYVTIDGRLSFHFNLLCRNCDIESTIRGRLQQNNNQYNTCAAALKLVALRDFVIPCRQSNHKIYKPTRQI